MKDEELLEGLHTVCKLAGVNRETSQRILIAAKGGEPKHSDGVLTTKAAAALLEIHPKSLHRYARRGLLHPIKRTARSIRWRRSEVEKLAYEGADHE